MNGILNINKPPGPTSFDVVRLVRDLTGVRRVGHGGTLDPAASGVLPVLLGQATRAGEYLLGAAKTYRAEVRLGVTTDTYDAQGRVVAEADASGVTLERVAEALRRFEGQVLQTPPMHSALKRQGTPLYRLARAGVEVERVARPVQVYAIRLLAWQPPQFTIEVECGRGTYIRSLAQDLGQVLGCGAHLRALVRTRVGPFAIEDALTLEALFAAAYGGYWSERLWALDWAMLRLPAAIVDDEQARALRFGQAIVVESAGPEDASPGPCRAYSLAGELVAVLALDAAQGHWRPAKVFPAQEEQTPAKSDPSLTSLVP
jgi:tRNA pseudouridine55 synthase